MNDTEKLKMILRSEEPNRIRGQYYKNVTKANQFVEAIKIVDDLMHKTGLFAYRASDVSEPLYVHSIEIKWYSAEVQINAKLFAPLLDNVDYLNMFKLTVTSELDTWLLSSEIYTEIEG